MKIAIFSIFRDSQKHLPQFFSTLREIERHHGGLEFSYFFFENDSTDNTVELTNEFMANRVGKFASRKLGAPKFGSTTDARRMVMMCAFRNECKRLSDGFDFDVAMIADVDVKFSVHTFDRLLKSLNSEPDAVMITANNRQNIPDLVRGMSPVSYYDAYPLRDKYGNNGLYFAECPFSLDEDVLRWGTGQLVQIQSGFGGMAVVRAEPFKMCRWSTNGACDHVNFCYEVGNFGKIYADPTALCYTEVDVSKINIPFFIEEGKKQLNMLSDINDVFNKSRSSVVT